jgi:hypothetical protein
MKKLFNSYVFFGSLLASVLIVVINGSKRDLFSQTDILQTLLTSLGFCFIMCYAYYYGVYMLITLAKGNKT